MSRICSAGMAPQGAKEAAREMEARVTARKGVRLYARLALLFTIVTVLTTTPGSASEAVRPPLKEQQDFLFFPLSVFSDPVARAAYWDTIKRTKVALSNGYARFEGEDLETLKAGGTELFLYRWFNGYYAIELLGLSYYSEFPEMKELFTEINSHPDWLINPVAPIAGGGAVTPAYFYDWANPELRAFYVQRLKEHIQAANYSGVFFDYIGDYALPPQAHTLYDLKHPGLSYNAAGLLMVQELRAALGQDTRIFANQAYRLDNGAGYYQQIDYDITESYGTSFTFGKSSTINVEGKGTINAAETYYRPWTESQGYKEVTETSPIAPMRLQPSAHVKLFHINYVNPWYQKTPESPDAAPTYRAVQDRPAIHYGYALGKIHNLDAYASDWSAWNGDMSIYREEPVDRVDLGEPLEATYREDDFALVRYFQKGFVVVTKNNQHNHQGTTYAGPTGEATPVEVALDPSTFAAGTTALWDVYNNGVVPGSSSSTSSVTIAPDYYPATQSYYPSGRVYLYV
jgi:hypothetical protein